MNAVDRLTMAAASRVLARIRRGELEVRWPDGSSQRFRAALPGPAATIHVTDLRLVRALATTGAIGLADGAIAGWYDTPDLATLIEVAALQLQGGGRPSPGALERAGRRLWSVVTDPVAPRGPLADVVQHYDLGNDFYAGWLDPTMSYSSAYFERDDMTLEEAQLAKYRRLAARAGIQAGMRVLEIGSGWGANAIFLARELGCDVTTMTVSREQARYVGKLAAEEGLANAIDVQLADFAEASGTYDRVVSVEMIESIPRSRWAELFGVMRDRLLPGGVVGLQSIWVGDEHWARSDAYPDFARRYVFPGGQVPAPKILRDLAARAGFIWRSDESFGASYARTLHAWGERFEAAWPGIAELGFDERFRRMWRYYLAYCEGGFRAGRAGVSQIALVR